jgi:hypothetical protein
MVSGRSDRDAGGLLREGESSREIGGLTDGETMTGPLVFRLGGRDRVVIGEGYQPERAFVKALLRWYSRLRVWDREWPEVAFRVATIANVVGIVARTGHTTFAIAPAWVTPLLPLPMAAYVHNPGVETHVLYFSGIAKGKKLLGSGERLRVWLAAKVTGWLGWGVDEAVHEKVEKCVWGRQRDGSTYMSLSWRSMIRMS